MYNQRRRWDPTPVLLPGKSHGWRSLVGCSPWGCEESDTTEWLHFHFSLSCIGEGNGNPLQCSCLENPRGGGAWWAAVYGVAQSQTRLRWLSSSSSNNDDGKIWSNWWHDFVRVLKSLSRWQSEKLTERESNWKTGMTLQKLTVLNQMKEDTKGVIPSCGLVKHHYEHSLYVYKIQLSWQIIKYILCSIMDLEEAPESSKIMANATKIFPSW